MGLPKRKSFDRGRPRGLTDRVVWRPIGELRKFPGNPRQHPEGQIAGLMRSIKRVWTNPILVDETGTILAGHGRLEAAKRLGMAQVPTVTIGGLSPSKKQAVVIADNRLPEQAVWDFDLLRGHFRGLIDLDFDVKLTGFSTGESIYWSTVRRSTRPAIRPTTCGIWRPPEPPYRNWVTFGTSAAIAWSAVMHRTRKPMNACWKVRLPR
jgi:hypothetical protein